MMISCYSFFNGLRRIIYYVTRLLIICLKIELECIRFDDRKQKIFKIMHYEECMILSNVIEILNGF